MNSTVTRGDSPAHTAKKVEVVYVDPVEIDRVVDLSSLAPETLERALQADSPAQCLADDFDLNSMEFIQLDFPGEFERVQQGELEWEDSQFFRRVSGEILGGQTKWGCRTPDELLRRLNEQIPELVSAIRSNGYMTQDELLNLGPSRGVTARENKSLLQATYSGDEVRVALDRHGKPMLLDGRHRLTIAKHLKLKAIPVRIVIRHEKWSSLRNDIHDFYERVGQYDVIPHFDLAASGHFGEDRWELISDAFERIDSDGCWLADVGSHLGGVSIRASQYGFSVVSMEHSEAAARLQERIMASLAPGVETWFGDARNYPDLSKFRIVLALNIFHHFFKSREGYDSLTRMLTSFVNMDYMILQTHVASPAGQMRNAYYNPDEDAFAQWIIDHSRLETVERIGRTPDGRALFLLRR